MKYVIELLKKEKRYLRLRLNEAELVNLTKETKELLLQIAEVSNAIQILEEVNDP